ncbi:hypothetical protein NW067_06585 [Mycoplasmopsis cynos]|uniref:hypothetical protein n=1 Tax=Mycoplasmopsis cynos TaxID=171284 RepID=UPI002206A8FF|nr:hypothetical protein [Mycoplasmopsis cynos]UWV82583.1 hypothetical protein NW067_06585 [Mycoplasmopsis cynos]UWV93871.1 hypothetical protein NW062_00815 [Mycoplasmopsis cynos]WAM03841.1 hypothetical protein ONA22_02325 [Mycoplasmopsis cynos]
MNYSENNAESLHKIHPEWKIYGSETSSAVKSRGIWYEPEKYDNGDKYKFALRKATKWLWK